MIDPGVTELLARRRTPGGCATCGVQLLIEKLWRTLTPEQRANAWRHDVARGDSSTACARCFGQARRAASPTRRVRNSVANVAEDWDTLADRRITQAANVRHLAPRLGMTEAALERAILRAKKLGLVAA